MRDMIGELWIQARIPSSFQYKILHVLKLLFWKLLVVYEHFTYWMTTLLSEMSIFCFGDVCKILVTSYTSKHASQSLSNKQIMYIGTYILKTTGHIWTFRISTTALLLKTFLVCVRFAWKIQLESYSPRHASVIVWYNSVCILEALHTLLLVAQLYLTTKLIYLMTAYYTPNDNFTVNNILFYKSNVG